MALKTQYYSVNGRLIGQKDAGGQTDYLTDSIGSTYATTDINSAVVNTYRYKPYGEQLSRTGTGADPSFRWIGAFGYRQTGRLGSELYVRARHYSSTQTRWTSTDPLTIRPQVRVDLSYSGSGSVSRNLFAGGGSISPYNVFSYVNCNPSTNVDPSGLLPYGVRGGSKCSGPTCDQSLSINVQGCATLSADFGSGGWGVSFGIEVCQSCYDCPCNGRIHCGSISGEVCVGIGVDFINSIEKALKALGSARTFVLELSAILVQEGSLPCNIGCPEKGIHGTFKLCFSVCVSFWSAEACVDIYSESGGHPITLAEHWGWCGLPSAEVCLSGGVEGCF